MKLKGKDAYESAKEMGKDAYDSAKVRGEDAYREAKDYIKAEPVKSIAITLGVGILLGWLLRK